MFNYTKELKPKLKAIGMTQKILAEKLNISTKAIRNWIAGTASPTMNRHEQVMDILGIDTLINHNEDDSSTTLAIKVPILSLVQAGEFTESVEDADPIGYLELPADMIPKNGYLLEVTGKSMTFDHSERQILSDRYLRYSLHEGESIIVDPNQIDINNLIGKVVVAQNSDGATVKLLYKDENKLCLMPLNSNYQDNEGIKNPSEAIILGRAIKVIKFSDL
ncbi:MAG: repressor LexA [Francisella sp.]|jgi:repressor LexA